MQLIGKDISRDLEILIHSGHEQHPTAGVEAILEVLERASSRPDNKEPLWLPSKQPVDDFTGAFGFRTRITGVAIFSNVCCLITTAETTMLSFDFFIN